MKKKLLPFILGCAMVATMPLAAHAEVSHHVGEDIVGGTSAAQGDKATADYNTYKGTADGHNEFTEHNDGSTTNTVAKVFGSTLGNTRNTAATTQSSYPVAIKNESKAESTIAADIADATFGETTNDCFGENYNESTDPLLNSGYTDLETSIPEFDMTIPASTVLPIGATTWKIGQVEMDGRYFVNPDRIGLIVSKKDFVRQENGADVASPTTADTITFDVKDGASGNSMVTPLDSNGYTPASNSSSLKILDFHQIGTKAVTFPYEYTAYSTTDYDAGKIVEIHEAKDVWVTSSDWANKNKGKFKGSITFTAYIVNGNLVENNNLATAPYPKTVDGQETQAGENDGWWPDTPAT